MKCYIGGEVMRCSKKMLVALSLLILKMPNYCDVTYNFTLNDSFKNGSCGDSNSDDELYSLSFDFGESIVVNDNTFTFVVKDNLLNNSKLTIRDYSSYKISKLEEHSFQVTLNLPNDDTSIEVAAYDNETSVVQNIYVSKNNLNQYGVSLRSLYFSKYLVSNLANQEYMDYGESYLENENLSIKASEFINQNSLSLNEYGVISGYLKWTDDSGNVHPLVNATVTLTTSVHAKTFITSTDSAGFYKLGGRLNLFPDEYGDATVHVYTRNDLVNMLIDDENSYEYVFNFYYSCNNNYNYSYIFTPDDEIGQAMDTFSAINAYADYAYLQLSLYDLPQCKIKYIEDDRSYYDDSIIYLSIYTGDLDKDVPTRYENWDLIGHEYGHHLQRNYFYQNYNGIHDSSKSDFYTYMINHPFEDKTIAKEKSMGLAWNESWPTYFSISAQNKFNDGLKTIKFVGDSSYTANNNISYDLNKYDTEHYKGEMCERTIMMFMYQLWDDKIDNCDNISIDEVDIFNVMMDYNPKYFYSFINILYETTEFKVDLSNLGRLLEEFDLGASNITTTYNDNTITFSWEDNAYTIAANYNYYEFGFNRFDLILLDKSYNQVFVKEGLSKTSYTLKRSDWKQITILNYGYIYLKAYDKHGGVSGPYATSYYRFTIIDNLKPIIIPDFKVGTSVIPNN